jgi:tetraacyldisaccharide 4'-kinase
VLAFCGIARPDQFFSGLESAGVSLAARIAFPDHHRYTQADLARLRSIAQSTRAAAFFTTEKDRVRLDPFAAQLAESIPLDTVRLHVEIEEESAILDSLLGLISPAR